MGPIILGPSIRGRTVLPSLRQTLWSKEPSCQKKTSGQCKLWSKGPSGQRDTLVNGTFSQRNTLVQKPLVNRTLVKISLVNRTLVKGSTPMEKLMSFIFSNFEVPNLDNDRTSFLEL